MLLVSQIIATVAVLTFAFLITFLITRKRKKRVTG
jgi:hypothetical protein